MASPSYTVKVDKMPSDGILDRQSEWSSQTKLGWPWLMTGWAVLYNIQVIWLLYGISFLCRELAIARLLYTTLPPFLHILYILANMCVVTWMLLLHFAKKPWIGLAALLAGAVLLHLVLLLMLRAHRAACPRLRTIASGDYWAIRALAHNGVAVHGVVTVALLFYQIALLTLDKTTLSVEWLPLLLIGLLGLYTCTWFLIDIFWRCELYSWVVSVYVTCLVLCVAGLIPHGPLTLDGRGVGTSFLALTAVVMITVKVAVALLSETGRYERTLEEENVVLTSLDQSELDKIERIDMIAKMFETDYS